MARLVYKLTGQKKSDEYSLGYYAEAVKGQRRNSHAPMPYTRSLPRFHRIIEVDEKGKRKARQVAYAPTENTIYMDEFINPNARIVKPKFKKGFLIVDTDTDPLLPEYLAKLDCNASKEGRNVKAAVKFMKIDKEDDAKTILHSEEDVAKRLGVFWNLPHNKLKAIANSVGQRTYGQSPDIWKLKLLEWAKHHVEKFEEAYKNPDIEYIDMITRAEDMSILKHESYTWLYNSVQILKVAHSKNRYTELVGKLINDPQLYRAICNEVDDKLGNTTRSIGEEAEQIDFNELDAKALLELCKTHELVTYRTGKHHEIIETGVTFGDKSNSSAIAAIEEDELLRKQLQAQLNKM